MVQRSDIQYLRYTKLPRLLGCFLLVDMSRNIFSGVSISMVEEK